MGFLNNSGFARLWSHIMLRLGDKVDKVDGKGLSTEDFTTEEKEKLAGFKLNQGKVHKPSLDFFYIF